MVVGITTLRGHAEHVGVPEHGDDGEPSERPGPIGRPRPSLADQVPGPRGHRRREQTELAEYVLEVRRVRAPRHQGDPGACPDGAMDASRHSPLNAVGVLVEHLVAVEVALIDQDQRPLIGVV